MPTEDTSSEVEGTTTTEASNPQEPHREEPATAKKDT